MARVSNKHNREQNLDFQGFLNDLQGWELSLKEKDKKLKAAENHDNKQGSSSAKKIVNLDEDDKATTRKAYPVNSLNDNALKFSYDAFSRLSSLSTDEDSPDATSEKDLGNEYFKQKKFKEAIDCYSRSIALSPTAVAFANRAMAYLKIKRFEEAENDCTEALNLDDRYIKAYSRRATARKELGKLKSSIEDSEFALRLEPQNQELKKQHADTKALYGKEILEKVSTPNTKPTGEAKKVGITEVHATSSGIAKETVSRSISVGNGGRKLESDGSVEGATMSSVNKSVKRDQGLAKKQEQKIPVQELASRAASRAMAEAAKNITPPKSAYQFEASWRGISGDSALQANFLKAIAPATLPQIFKNALSASILINVVKCVATFFIDETELAVQFLNNLTKVPRFDVIIMCLSNTDRADLRKIWEEVFRNTTVSAKHKETLSQLHLKYCT